MNLKIKKNIVDLEVGTDSSMTITGIHVYNTGSLNKVTIKNNSESFTNAAGNGLLNGLLLENDAGFISTVLFQKNDIETFKGGSGFPSSNEVTYVDIVNKGVIQCVNLIGNRGSTSDATVNMDNSQGSRPIDIYISGNENFSNITYEGEYTSLSQQCGE
ncbi:MAG: hypothetical protein EB127_23040 [Alphaproteobacteria bacterium]|nr:hypothetical protein [Alphaproteobacteria bacterium]